MPTRAARQQPARIGWLSVWLRLCTWLICCLIGCVIGLPPSAALAADTTGDVLPVPPLSGHVIDQSQTLSPDQQQALERKLGAFEQARGTQMVVLLVASTQPEDIAAYAQRVGDTWKIGRREVGDGLLIVVAKQDRRIRIEVAKALEGAVPDLAASQIIERAIKPAFKAGDYAGGLNLGVDQLIARIQGENLPLPDARPATSRSHNEGFQFNDLLVFGLIGVPIVFGVLSSILGRKGGALATGLVTGGLVWLVTTSLFIALAAWIAASLFALAFGTGGRGGPGGWGGPPMGGGWGGGGGGGGGGWSSGGGGDFGGGGASGNW